MKVSNFSGVADGSDDSLLMLSFTSDGGITYQTKKIRLVDLIDDFQVEDLANVSGGGEIGATNGQGLLWNSVTQQWEPGLSPVALSQNDIDTDITIPIGYNAASFDSVTIDPGVTVTLDQNSTWIVLA